MLATRIETVTSACDSLSQRLVRGRLVAAKVLDLPPQMSLISRRKGDRFVIAKESDYARSCVALIAQLS